MKPKKILICYHDNDYWGVMKGVAMKLADLIMQDDTVITELKQQGMAYLKPLIVEVMELVGTHKNLAQKTADYLCEESDWGDFSENQSQILFDEEVEEKMKDQTWWGNSESVLIDFEAAHPYAIKTI